MLGQLVDRHLALASQMGAELRQPLGLSILGGLVLSQLLTLYTTPVVYVGIDRLRLGAIALGRSLFSSSDSIERKVGRAV